MRGALPVVALGAVMALAALLLVLVVTAPPPTDAQRADRLAAELRCPDCQGLSVADSESVAAREIRRQVDELVAAGATDDEVRARFVDRYGEWILLAPSSPVPWLVPILLVAGGAAALVLWLRRRSTFHRPAEATAPDAAARLRVREEAEALDA